MADAHLRVSDERSPALSVRDPVYVVATGDYSELDNKPSIEGTTLVGDKTFQQLGMTIATEHDIDKAFFG